MIEHPRSELPQDSAYWDQLARRIGDDAAGPLAAYAAAGQPWYDVLARRAPWLVAASLAAMLGLWLLLPAADSPSTWAFERALAPDDVAGTLIAGRIAPSVDALLVELAPAGDERDRR